jgi:enoyl-CoA hydratase/carnithine racemase
MQHQYATYAKRDHVAVVTISRPEVMNALHPPANAELSALWDDFAADLIEGPRAFADKRTPVWSGH